MTDPPVPPRDRLIVALDVADVELARAMIGRLGDSVTFYKIGYQLAFAGGLPLVRELADASKKVFLDLKLHDIGNTVARGIESLAGLGATFPDGACLSANHEGGRRGAWRIKAEDSRGDGADLV